jgi:hypothetical protein
MKNYVKPSFDYVQLRPEEGIANYGSCDHHHESNIFDFLKDINFSYVFSFTHWFNSIFGGKRRGRK